jgi:Tol biopolymer transport system component
MTMPEPHRPVRIVTVATMAALPVLLASTGVGAHAVADTAAHSRHEKSQLAFSRYFPDGSGATVLVNADGSDKHAISAQAGLPRWSPDGGRIVITPCTDPARVPASCPEIISRTGRVLKRLPIPRRFRRAEVTFWQPAAWSPDGRRLAGSADSTDTRLNGVYTVRARDGRGLRRVTANPRGVDIPGAFSPDGRRIAFTRGDDRTGTGVGVFVVNTDGTGLKRVSPPGMEVNDDPGLVDWSPDGRRIAFAGHPSPDRRFTLFTVRPDGTHLRRVPIPLPCAGLFEDPHGRSCDEPAWAPSSRTLAFIVFNPNTLDAAIYTVGVDGRHLHRLTSGAFFDETPDWRPTAQGRP